MDGKDLEEAHTQAHTQARPGTGTAGGLGNLGGDRREVTLTTTGAPHRAPFRSSQQEMFEMTLKNFELLDAVIALRRALSALHAECHNPGHLRNNGQDLELVYETGSNALDKIKEAA